MCNNKFSKNGIFYEYDNNSVFEGILKIGKKIKRSYYMNKIKKYEGKFKDNNYNEYERLFKLKNKN